MTTSAAMTIVTGPNANPLVVVVPVVASVVVVVVRLPPAVMSVPPVVVGAVLAPALVDADGLDVCG
jgi:hypothetical protein